MGGAVREGNWTPAAEFNIWVDPEAARIVFRSGLPITMVGLDVTHQAIFRDTEVDRLDALGTPVARVFADLLRFYARFHRERYGWDGSPIHDAVAVAHVAVPGLVTTEPYRVDVETTGEITRGRTVVDTRGGRRPAAQRGRRARHRPGPVRRAAHRGDRLVRLIALRLRVAPAGPQGAGVSQTGYSVMFSGLPSFADRSYTRRVPYWPFATV